MAAFLFLSGEVGIIVDGDVAVIKIPHFMKVTPQELAMRLAWPLDYKLEYACKIISQFVLHFDGEVYLSFSGGKDSKIVRDIIDKIWDGTFKHITPNWIKLIKLPKPISVFSNTGLEFPEIVEYVKQHDNIVIVKPKMGFTRVIKEVGVAVGSKMITEMVERLKKYIANPSPKTEATKNLYMTGFKKDGTYSQASKLSKRWHILLDAPFNVSNRCCDILKKEPFETYAKQTGFKPITGTRVGEGNRRTTSYYQTGCNSFDQGKEMCRPISIFKEEDIFEYAVRFDIKFASVYYNRIVDVEQLDGTFKTENLPAETRTGCTFCMFGLHLEDKMKNNRIQRLAISHPKYYDIVVNKCGLGDILSWLKLPYKPMANSCQIDMFKRTD